MIRDAKFADIPAMAELLERSHRRSKYNGRMGLSAKAVDQLFTGAIAGQKQNGPGASFVQVAEEDGKVVGFMVGVLNRIYNVGDKLAASDVFLINEGRNFNGFKMLDNYVSWAESNPKVIEIGLSWSDAIPSAKDIASVYRRKGFTLTGEQFTLCPDLGEMAA